MKTNYSLKSKWPIIFIFTFAFLLFFQLGPSRVLAADSNIAAAEKTINVSGDGKVTVAPDLAYLSIGVLTENTSAAQAEKANSVSMNNVIDSIKKLGINADDIKTTNYSINPVYDYDKTTGSSIIKGYTVLHSLTVTIRDISKVGQVIDAAVKSGANVSNDIVFGVSDYEKYYNMALINAVSNAVGKAQATSKYFNIPLTTPVKITENSSGVPTPYPVTMGGKFEASDSSASTSIQVGTYEIKANVSLVYQY
jgi:uncharacterized protein YggE